MIFRCFSEGGRDVADRIHYCCKYVTKQQNQIDLHVAVVVAALIRRQDREHIEFEAVGSQDRAVLARKRVAALMFNMTNKQEIAGPLASLYLYRGSCCYSSAKCAALPLGDAVRQLTMAEEYSCTLVNESEDQGSSKYHAVSFLDNYIYRPKCLHPANLYEFTMWYFKKKNDNATASKLQFLEGHPLRETHSLGKRHDDAVPVINGFRMPSSDNEADSELVFKRAVLALVLFKPFRTLDELIGVADAEDKDAWLSTFNDWKSKRSKFVETIMENMQDYYQGARMAEMQSRSAAEAARTTTANDRVHDEGEESGDDLFSDSEGNDEWDMMVQYPADEGFVSMWDDEGDTILDSSSLHPASCPTSATPDAKTAQLIDIFQKHEILRSAADATVRKCDTRWREEQLPSVVEMKKWVLDAETDNPILLAAAPEIPGRDTQVLELLSTCLLDYSMEWKSSSGVNISRLLTKRFASISDISVAYTLNKGQHVALKAIGTALFSRWKEAEASDHSGAQLEATLRDGQLLMFLGGEGGTGKSRIIDAVQTLCGSWGRPGCMLKTALTGKAATLIGGRTLASFLLQIRKKRTTDAIVNLELIIIDEVSMMKKHHLAQLDKRLRVAKRVHDVVFGGVHVILVGDFLQLPPVGGTPLYEDPVKRKTRRKVAATELAGYQLWCLFDTVIMLEECVRFRKDPEWGRGCHLARLGVWTPEFVDIINARVMTYADTLTTSFSRDKLGTFVTPENATRVAING